MIGTFNNREQNLRKLAKIRAIKLAEEHVNNQTNSTVQGSSTPANTYNRNTRNPSITNNVNNANYNSTQRGRSMVINPQNQVKQSLNNNPKLAISNNGQTAGSILVTKKSFNGISAAINGDEGLKLPKVLPPASSNLGSATAGSLSMPNNKNNNAYRTGSRESRR